MTDCLKPQMSEENINAISSLGLAHLGDSVYELMVRSWLCMKGHGRSGKLHKLTVGYVSAPSQARAAEKILPCLTENEKAVYKRGRNTRVNSVPSRATIGEYHAATGLEALWGWLYLHGDIPRLNELFEIIMSEEN